MSTCHAHRLETPEGPLGILLDPQGRLRRIAFLDPEIPFEQQLEADLETGETLKVDPEHTNPVAEQLADYLAGRRSTFDLELAPKGTDFQHAVWAELRRIPPGETRSYGEIAQALGRPGAARAVGRANATNPLPLVVPCHRVVGADGSLTGFAGGLGWKRRLLAIEGVESPSQARLPFQPPT